MGFRIIYNLHSQEDCASGILSSRQLAKSLTFANILTRTGYRRFKIPAISSAILFVLQRTVNSAKVGRHFCRSRQKKGTFQGVVYTSTRCFVRKVTNLPRFWILSPFFQKNSERSRQKPERNRQKQRRKIHHFLRTHRIGETSKTCLVKPAKEHMSNF